MTELFDTEVAPQLKAGAETAREAALATMQQWGVSNTVGGLHWATYKATCRRHGVWRVNMNEGLVEPIFKAVVSAPPADAPTPARFHASHCGETLAPRRAPIGRRPSSPGCRKHSISCKRT